MWRWRSCSGAVSRGHAGIIAAAIHISVRNPVIVHVDPDRTIEAADRGAVRTGLALLATAIARGRTAGGGESAASAMATPVLPCPSVHRRPTRVGRIPVTPA